MTGTLPLYWTYDPIHEYCNFGANPTVPVEVEDGQRLYITVALRVARNESLGPLTFSAWTAYRRLGDTSNGHPLPGGAYYCHLPIYCSAHQTSLTPPLEGGTYEIGACIIEPSASDPPPGEVWGIAIGGNITVLVL